MINAFEKLDLSIYKEVIFCGYGEPLTRLDALLEISRYLKLKHNELKIRINTNGLGNLINKKDVVPLLTNTIDSISISLNASNPEKYLEITRSIFGIESYNALLDFAVACQKYINDVRLTVVDVIGKEEIEKCRKICEKYNLKLKVRELV